MNLEELRTKIKKIIESDPRNKGQVPQSTGRYNRRSPGQPQRPLSPSAGTRTQALSNTSTQPMPSSQVQPRNQPQIRPKPQYQPPPWGQQNQPLERGSTPSRGSNVIKPQFNSKQIGKANMQIRKKPSLTKKY